MIKLQTALVISGVIALLQVTACSRDTPRRSTTRQVGQAAPEEVHDQATQTLPIRFGSIGRSATRAEISAWNIDVNASGDGLPAGRGTYARGASLFVSQCAACHGAHGEGIPPFPKLIGREPRDGFPFGRDAKYAKTIGNYWPYATTVYDYINRAMPFPAPGSLRPDDIYSLVDFLLAENEIIDKQTILDARSLRGIRMPARNRFVMDNRTGGRAFR